jgi:3-methylcrotonyl-CoA carboxylase beta subunit
VNDHLVDTEDDALFKVREIIGALAGSPTPPPPRVARSPRFDGGELTGLVSADPKTPVDARELIARLVDGSDLVEFKPAYGASLVCGTAFIHGYPVGILANNGVLFSESALKGAHFIELLNQRRTPILYLQNITGFMVGTKAERGGIAKDSAKMVYAVATSRVPQLTVIVGGSYGAGNYGMCGRGFRPRFLFAWPNAKIATMSADVAVTVLTELRQKSLTKAEAARDEMQQLIAATREQFDRQSDAYYATSRLWDDGIIEPAETRDVLGLCLALVGRSPIAEGPWPVYRM